MKKALVCGLTILILVFHAVAAEIEYDECFCRQVQVGAQSSLRGGVCQRTEAGKCLMQWGAGSRQKVPVGNGQSQEEASTSAEKVIRSSMSGDFKVTPLFSPAADSLAPMQVAVTNLSRLS